MVIKNTNICKHCQSMSPCFRTLSDEELDKIALSKVHVKYKKREIVAKQGSFVSHIIFIKKGLLKLYIESETDNKDLIINFFSDGELLGVSSLFEPSSYKYSVATLKESELCLFEVNEIKQLIIKNPEFALSLLKRAQKSTMHAYNQLFNLTHKQMAGRIASALLYLADNVFRSDTFELILTRNELANFTAMSTMSAVRIINDLKEQKIISNEKGVIEIINKISLLRISKFG